MRGGDAPRPGAPHTHTAPAPLHASGPARSQRPPPRETWVRGPSRATEAQSQHRRPGAMRRSRTAPHTSCQAPVKPVGRSVPQFTHSWEGR